MKMHTQKRLLATSMTAALLTLTACGGGGGGDKGAITNVQMSGAVVDGLTAYSKIWVDVNGNKQRDNDESWAYTDALGYFSNRPVTTNSPAINYCADPKDTANYKYCLEVSSDAKANGYQICSAGGRDKLTGKEYGGNMCLSIANANTGLYVNPISTMAAKLTDAALVDLQKYFDPTDTTSVTAFREKIVTLNTFDTSQSSALDYLRIFKFAFQAHKIAEALSTFYVDSYNATLSNSDLKLDKAFFVPIAFEAIADYLNGNNITWGTTATTDLWTPKTVDPLSNSISGSANAIAVNFAYKITQLTFDLWNTQYPAEKFDDQTVFANLATVAEGIFVNSSQASTNIDALLQSLNAALDINKPATIDKKAFVGEVVTETVKNTGSSGTTPSNLTSNAENLVNNTNLDPTTTDFDETKSIVQLNTAITTATTFDVNPAFNVNDDITPRYIGSEDSQNKIFLFLKDDKANDGVKKGTMSFCIIDKQVSNTDDAYQFVNGSYEIDSDKQYLMFLNALGQDALLKNLKPATSYTSDTTNQCSATNVTSCISVTYKDLTGTNSSSADYVTNFFGSTTLTNADVIASYPSTMTATIDADLCKSLVESNQDLQTIKN